MKPPRRPHADAGRPGKPAPGKPPTGKPPTGKPAPGQGAGRGHGPRSDRGGPGGPSRREDRDPRAGGNASGWRGDDRRAAPGHGGPPRQDDRPRHADRPAQAAREQGGRAHGGREQPHHGPRPDPARPPREAPGGSIWLYGTHAVAAALANPARRLRRLLLTEEAEAAIGTRLPRPWAIPAERSERGRIDHLLGHGAIHQGAALLVDPLQPPSLQAVVARPGPVLVLDQVTDPRNVGAILRAAAAFGVAGVVTQERNAPEETGALAKAASGALETMPVLRAVNIARTLVALRAAGFWVVGLDAGGASLSGPALSGRRVALVLGSEGEGLRRLTRETCDETAGIAMPGAGAGLDSLNVAAAAAIALYELARRP